MANNTRVSRLPDVVDLDTTAAILGKHRQTVTKYLLSGELKGRKAGRKWIITRQAIEEFLFLTA